MINFSNGDIFQSNAEMLINPVNCVGVMGKGLALEFKKRYPKNFEVYKQQCSWGKVAYGKGVVTQIYGYPIIFNLPTKKHWRDKSDLKSVELSVLELVKHLQEHNVKSVAIPAIGAGLGGLDWQKMVKPMLIHHLNELSTDITIYEPKEQQ